MQYVNIEIKYIITDIKNMKKEAENMSQSTILSNADPNKKHVRAPEFMLYLMGVFFYTTMTGVVGANRNTYLTNVLRINDINSNYHSLFNTIITVVPFVLNFFITLYIDGKRTGKKGKFRPIMLVIIVPMSVIMMLTFITPPQLTGSLVLIYVVTIALLWSVMCTFGNAINMLPNVMTPNMKERDQVLSFRSFASAVGNSAPMLFLLIIGLIWKNNEGLQYIICAAFCGVLGISTVLLGMNLVRERIPYSAEKKNPLLGFRDIIKNRHAHVVILSEFLKSFRGISTFMEGYLAIVLIGDPSKKIIVLLPVGIGTAVGMLVINALLKKFNARVLYIASGIYSVCANIVAFTIGYFYFTTDSKPLMFVFIACLFLIGLQFGASNLLPLMFQADVLEDLELKTGKRLDATLPYVIGLGTTISGAIAGALAPKLLDNVVHYDFVDDVVSPDTNKIALLFFYTIVHGIMMFLAGVPFFFYKLTGKEKERIHNEVLEMRKAMEAE